MQELLQGIIGMGWDKLIMMAIGGILIYLAIAKDYEPMLLLPIGSVRFLPISHSPRLSAMTGFLPFFIMPELKTNYSRY